MIISFILIMAGFIMLVKGADFLVSGASALAKKIGVSDLAIGLTVVAFGTSLPELCVNVIASVRGNQGIVIGNVLGSNIFNILLILGVSSLVYPIAVTKGTVWKEIPFSLLAALVAAMANDAMIDVAQPSVISMVDGAVLLAFFAIFIYYVGSISKSSDLIPEPQGNAATGYVKPILMIAGGLVLLLLGGKFVVEGAVDLAGRLGVSQTLIGLTVVAPGDLAAGIGGFSGGRLPEKPGYCRREHCRVEYFQYFLHSGDFGAHPPGAGQRRCQRGFRGADSRQPAFVFVYVHR